MKNLIYSCTVIVLMASCGTKNDEKKASEAKADTAVTEPAETVSLTAHQIQTAGVEVGYPVLENISATTTLQGEIELPPQNIVSLSFPIGGYIKSTTMLPGKQIRKGQVLAVMEDMQFIQLQQDYLTARTNFELAKTEFSRQRELNASKASSDKVFQQAKAEMERQQILMSALAEKLKLIGIAPQTLTADNVRREVSVTSPINGFVSKVNFTVGKYTAPTDVLFELIDPSDIHLSLKAFEADLGKIAPGERVVAFANNNPEKKYTAKVFLVNRTFDESRMAQIHCHFERYDPSLVPGMFMNASVSVKDVKAIVVPEDAIVRWENKYYVFIENETGQFKMSEVKPGVRHEGMQQIEGENISSASKLVTKNAFALLMKIKNSDDEG